jgi:hypothetical protein
MKRPPAERFSVWSRIRDAESGYSIARIKGKRGCARLLLSFMLVARE